MTPQQVLANIVETNLSYMDLARKLLAADRPAALLQLGISDESATLLLGLSPLQLTKVCTGSTLLCSAHINDDMVLGLLTSHGRRRATNDAHVAYADGREHDCSYEGRAQQDGPDAGGKAALAAPYPCRVLGAA
jgi:flagellar transcriptional activator FlhD